MARAGGVTGSTVVLTTIAVSPLLPLLRPPYVTCISCGMELPRLPNDQPKDKGENTKKEFVMRLSAPRSMRDRDVIRP